ncbi:MAG: hypothetical protein KatS3mg131_2691 [Candidatus Tectimicrobiota bacterium]|nr:MAG: hypothetical protein KatS3mg131_2691 [Candidatus Tectomicrobia bacterium]
MPHAGRFILTALAGLLLAACVRPLPQRVPEARAVRQTLEAFWAALPAGSPAALDGLLTPDAMLVRAVERAPEVEEPLFLAVQQPEARALLAAAARAALVNFAQPAPQEATVETYFDVERRDDIQRLRLRWHLRQGSGGWQLQRVHAVVWTFPRVRGGGGP